MAKDEAVPINYDLRKEYCNHFDLKDAPSVIPNDYLLYRKRFIGRTSLGNEDFWRSRRPFPGHDEIGHLDATRVMWDGCVLTKFIGEIPSAQMKEDMLFANKLVKHTKSNAIVLAKGKQLMASGVGQTSRVDALNQAVEKAGHFKFDLKGAVMASDAFFPFPDCVEIADKAGITAVIQPGGSVRDQESVDYCNAHGMSMVTTGFRHFKH